MSGRACAKEEICCRKAKCLIEAHEANLRDGNYEDDPSGTVRVDIRNLIDKMANRLEREMLKYADGQS